MFSSNYFRLLTYKYFATSDSHHNYYVCTMLIVIIQQPTLKTKKTAFLSKFFRLFYITIILFSAFCLYAKQKIFFFVCKNALSNIYKIGSNVSHFNIMLKFLGNRLTDQDQILYTYSFEISKTKDLQLYSLKLPESHKLNPNLQILTILYTKYSYYLLPW